MIEVVGNAQLSFMFPADRATAYEYYRDIGRLTDFLPHISLIERTPDNKYRMLYNTTELGAYHVRIFCDVVVEYAEDYEVLRILPTNGLPEVEEKSGLNHVAAMGEYRSESYFFEEGDETRIEYQLDLQAMLLRPLGLQFMPGVVLNKIARNIADWRIKEIAGGFIENSIAQFPEWLAQQETA